MLPLTLPPFEIARSSLPSSTPGAVIQALIPYFIHPGIARVYLINVYSQKLVGLLEHVGTHFGIDAESREYHSPRSKWTESCTRR
jgi:hypothetical protein